VRPIYRGSVSPDGGRCRSDPTAGFARRPGRSDWRPGRSDGTEDHESQKVRKHERRKGESLRGRLVYLDLCREEREAW
jgi:hypothetical protein